MFTVKLFKGHSVKLIQAEQVDVRHRLVDPQYAGVAEVSITNYQRGLDDVVKADKPALQQSFFIADTRKRPIAKQVFADTVELYDKAFIENQHGATTEVVNPPSA